MQSGYIPDLDADLEKKSGICFDYAAVMTAMLRCQGISTKLVFSYTGKIYFDGKTWKFMDPSFASTGNSSAAIMKYFGNGQNHMVKYLY